MLPHEDGRIVLQHYGILPYHYMAYNLEDHSLNLHCHENLKSHNLFQVQDHAMGTVVEDS
jgi:hypothetical protein